MSDLLGGRVPREAAMLLQLNTSGNHCIPTLLAFFQDSFFAYLVMPYSRSTDLFDYIDTHTIEEANVKQIFFQVCQVVSHLHSSGIIHRDIKVYFAYSG